MEHASNMVIFIAASIFGIPEKNLNDVSALKWTLVMQHGISHESLVFVYVQKCTQIRFILFMIDTTKCP